MEEIMLLKYGIKYLKKRIQTTYKSLKTVYTSE